MSGDGRHQCKTLKEVVECLKICSVCIKADSHCTRCIYSNDDSFPMCRHYLMDDAIATIEFKNNQVKMLLERKGITPKK